MSATGRPEREYRSAKREGPSVNAKKSILFVLAGIGLIALPFLVGDRYQLHLATLIGAYWVLIAGLNLVTGFSGQLSVGHVGLLAIGAYAFAIVAGKLGMSPLVAVAVAGAMGGSCGLVLGLPALRLPDFYFAMATLAFSLMVTEFVLAQEQLTGGGIGIAVPGFPPPFDTQRGTYWLILIFAAIATFLTWNVARLMWGRALISIRDSVVTARAVGVPVYRAKLTVFIFSGVSAGVAGALFASLQSYITPDTFVFDLGMFFFVSIIIGGRGSILGPFIGTVVLTALPELASPLAKLGTFFYGLLLLAVVLLVPEGVGASVQKLIARFRPGARESHVVTPDLALLASTISRPDAGARTESLDAAAVSIAFGGIKALDNVSLELRPGEIHGLIGPNGSGKTTLLNLLSGYYQPNAGSVKLGVEDLSHEAVQRRPMLGIARTFQKPRLLAPLTVLDNVMLGCWRDSKAGFLETALGLPRARREDRTARQYAEKLVAGVGLAHAIGRRASLLEHAEQRFLEIARALAARPRFIMLDEPAGGLTDAEINHLADVILVLRDAGLGVLLVEHHTDFVFRVCDRVTTLDLGKMIMHGPPAAVQADPEVIRVYLGA
jgi:branched-chain amino acid transport system permease protein